MQLSRIGSIGTRNARIGLVIVLLVWSITTLLWIQPGYLLPDGAGFFVYLPSAWFDRDLLFYNEWQRLGLIRDGVILHKEITRTGHLANHWTVGPAIVWSPLYLIADLVRDLSDSPRNGVSLPYNLAAVFTSACAGLVALAAAMRIARRYCMNHAVVGAAIATWLGSTLLFYSLIHATMAHAVSAAMSALVVLGAVELRDRNDSETSFLTGVAAGLAFAIRPHNAPFILVPALVARRIPDLWFVTGTFLGVLPQFIVSWYIYGTPGGFITGGDHALYASFERIWTWEPLFSWYHGLFSWTPIAAVGVAGLFYFLRIDRQLAVVLIGLFLFQWLLNATADRPFWAGASFGARRFDSATVLIVIGTAALFSRIGPVAAGAVATLCVSWSLSLFFAARTGLDLAIYHTPSELMGAQLTAIGDLGRHFEILAAVPAGHRATVLFLLGCFGLVGALAVVVARSTHRRVIAAGVGAWMLTVSGFLFWCGSNDARRLTSYRDLISQNAQYAPYPAGVDFRVDLLRDELRYLEKSGRAEAAERTRRDLNQRLQR
jgi:hypothetical protein